MDVFSQYLPWGENRPFNDAYSFYNCLIFRTWMKNIGGPHFQIENVEVHDEVKLLARGVSIGFRTLHGCMQDCGSLYCPVCRLDAAVRHVRVRGLCPDSIYNSAYTLTMTGEGTVSRRFGYSTTQLYVRIQNFKR